MPTAPFFAGRGGDNGTRVLDGVGALCVGWWPGARGERLLALCKYEDSASASSPAAPVPMTLPCVRYSGGRS